MTACWGAGAFCGRTDTRRYLNADACPDHTPARIAGNREPATMVDPARTDAAMRIMHTSPWAKGGTDLDKEKPGGYVSKQRAARIAAEYQARTAS